MKATPEQIQAIQACDKDYDGQFYYGVSSTRIFCKPSCKSRMPKPENIDIQTTTQSLLDLGYRPCKRCKPTNENLPDHDWIQQVSDYIDRHYSEKLTLAIIAEETHSSPFHLHRKFKDIKDLTIGKYLIKVRMEAAIELLKIKPDKSISAIAIQVGIPNFSQFVRDFKKYYGQTPTKLREEYNNEIH